MAKEKVLTAVLQLKDRNFGAGLRQGSSGLDKFRRMIYRTGDGVDKFGRNTASSFKRVGEASTSLKNTIVGVSTAILGLKAVDWAKDQVLGGVEAASSLENYRLTLNTVMKDSKKAGETMKWASQFANVTPFETDQVVEGTVRLQSYGIEAKKTMGTIGDMAAVMNKDLMQAIEAVADAQTGELERMKEFGITKNMIQKKSDAMYKKGEVINKKGQIVDQKKFNKALFAIMNERFKGGMELQATTFKGITSNITGTWKTGLAEMIGVTTSGTIRQGSLFEKLKKKADEVSKQFSKWANDGTFKKLGDKASSMLNKFEQKIPAIKQFFVDLKTPMQVVGDILKKIGEGFQGIIKFTNEHPDIAKAIGLTAAGAVIAKKTGLLSLGKGIYDTASKTLGGGNQTIKAAVVNVYGAKINGAGTGLDVPAGGKSVSGKAGKLKTFLGGAKSIAKLAIIDTMATLFRAGPQAALTTGTIAGTLFAGSNFDKARNDPNSIYSSKIMANNPIPKAQPANKQQYMMGVDKSGGITSKQAEGMQSYLKDIANKPNNVNVSFNGGITVQKEADIDNIVSKIVSGLSTHMGNVSSVSMNKGISAMRW